MQRIDDPVLRATSDLVHAIRPAWHLTAIDGALHTLVGRHHPSAIAVAAIDAAFDQNVRSPAGITRRLTHAAPAVAPAARPTPAQPETGRVCSRCGNVHVTQLDDACPLPLNAADVHRHATAARRALRAQEGRK